MERLLFYDQRLNSPTSFLSIPDHLNSMTELYIKNGSGGNFTTESTVRIYGIQ